MKKLVEHHVKYLEIDGVDETIWMEYGEHRKLHHRLRKEGKCNIPVDELNKISQAAHCRTPKHKKYQATYYASPEATAAREKYKASPEGKATRTKYEASPGRIASKAAYQTTPECKAAREKFLASPGRKAWTAAYYSTPERKAAQAKNAARRKKNTHTFTFTEQPSPHIILNEKIIYYYNTGNVSYSASFHSTHAHKLPVMNLE